jgi:hypothetical protein
MSKFLIALVWCLPLAFYSGDDHGTAFMLFFGAVIGATITGELLGVSFDED